MAFSTYSELCAEVASWLAKSNLTAQIPGFIALAEARMNREVRCNRMIARAAAIVQDSFASLPDDFLAPRTIRVDGRRLDMVSEDQLGEIKRLIYGPVTHFAMVGGEFEFAPSPSQGAALVLTYYAKIPALSASTPTNWVLQDFPDAYLRAALMEAAIYLRNTELLASQAAMFDAVKGEIHAAEVSDQFGASLSPTPNGATV